ncbi:MAG: acyltransferase [Xanthomonadales bacterium]|nr:acyltransferase [Xanthomonadales bacterium]
MTEPAASSATASAHLPALDGLRALASLFVFNVHAFGYCLVAFYGWTETEVRGFPGWGVESALLWLHRSLYGVDLFFVLSGFLMARQFDFARARPVDFLARRGLRILPAYGLALVLAALARWWVDGTVFSLRDWLQNLAFLHGFLDLGLTAINPVTWSMSYEVAFYLAIPLLALGFAVTRRDWVAHLVIATVLLVLVLWIGTPLARLHGYGLLFLVGIAVARVPLAALARHPLWIAAAAAWVAFVVSSKFVLLLNRDLAYYPLSMLGSGGLLILAITYGQRHPQAPGRVLQWIGDRSYSLFLLHSIVVYLLGATLGPTVKPLGPIAASLIFVPTALVLSLIASDLSYRIAERPYFRKRKQEDRPQA